MVVSPEAYNRKIGLVLLCPITSQIKGFPFEVMLPGGLSVNGVVLADQVKSLDWKVRRAERMAEVPEAVVTEVIDKLMPLLKIS